MSDTPTRSTIELADLRIRRREQLDRSQLYRKCYRLQLYDAVSGCPHALPLELRPYTYPAKASSPPSPSESVTSTSTHSSLVSLLGCPEPIRVNWYDRTSCGPSSTETTQRKNKHNHTFFLWPSHDDWRRFVAGSSLSTLFYSIAQEIPCCHDTQHRSS